MEAKAVARFKALLHLVVVNLIVASSLYICSLTNSEGKVRNIEQKESQFCEKIAVQDLRINDAFSFK